MKKMIIILLILGTSLLLASEQKIVVFGMVNCSMNEYTNETIKNVSYKAWLIQGSGPAVGSEIIRSTDGLSQSCTTMFPDSVESPIRGASMIDLQHFPAWGPGNIIYVYMKDNSNGFDAEAYYTIHETDTEADYIFKDGTGLEWVLLGFEDCFVLEGSGSPYWLATPAGTEAKTFVYPCVTTTGTDYNFVGLPVETGWTKGSDFDPMGTNIESVTRFDTAAQMAETGVYSSVFGWCKDIPVQTGSAYCISAKNNFDFTVVGDSIPISYNLITTSGTDYNYIVHPLTKAGITTSKDLGIDIGASYVSTILKWNAATQAFAATSQVGPIWANPFPTSVGQPLGLSMKANTVWPSGKENDGDITEDETSMQEKNLKGSPARARILFFHITKESDGSDFIVPDETDGHLHFNAWISSRPADIMTQDSFDCGFIDLNGYSAGYINLANFQFWQANDEINIEFPLPDGYDPMRYYNYWKITLDNSSSTIFKGFNIVIAGNGTPMTLPSENPSIVQDNVLPYEIDLNQNYPNPFNPETEISFSLPKEEQVTLSVFNSEGQLVKELMNDKVSAGNHSIDFNAENLNSGIYFYTLETVSTKLSKKMLLIK